MPRTPSRERRHPRRPDLRTQLVLAKLDVLVEQFLDAADEFRASLADDNTGGEDGVRGTR